MLCRCCGLCSRRNRKINIVLGEARWGGGGNVTKTLKNRILLPSVSTLVAQCSSVKNAFHERNHDLGTRNELICIYVGQAIICSVSPLVGIFYTSVKLYCDSENTPHDWTVTAPHRSCWFDSALWSLSHVSFFKLRNAHDTNVTEKRLFGVSCLLNRVTVAEYEKWCCKEANTSFQCRLDAAWMQLNALWMHVSELFQLCEIHHFVVYDSDSDGTDQASRWSQMPYLWALRSLMDHPVIAHYIRKKWEPFSLLG